jgi:hypothetical protein
MTMPFGSTSDAATKAGAVRKSDRKASIAKLIVWPFQCRREELPDILKSDECCRGRDHSKQIQVAAAQRTLRPDIPAGPVAEVVSSETR